MKIRNVEPSDADAIAKIYNYYIEYTHHSFETDVISTGEMAKRIIQNAAVYPYLVAEEDESLLGYAFAHEFKSRRAYANSIEISVYVQPDTKTNGIGSRLYEQLFPKILETDTHAIIAGIALPNEASIRLHEKMGLVKVAHFKEVGFKLGRWIDVGYWERLLE